MKNPRFALFALLVLVSLSACASTQPGIDVRPVEVPVIRVEKCVAGADIPRQPAPLARRPADARAALDVAVSKVFEWQTYGGKADALLQGCAATTPAP